jgi:hypothetical protein
MSNTENIANTLIRDGASQQQRTAAIADTAPLSAGYVKMDERSKADLLSLLYRYARFVLYYNERGLEGLPANTPLLPQDDWQAFFRNNAPFQYAFVQQFPAADLENAYNTTRARLDKQFAENGYWPLLNSILAVAIQLNNWYMHLKVLQQETALLRMLESLIRKDLSKALQRLVAISNTFTIADELPYDGELRLLIARPEWGISTPDQQLAKDTYLLKLAPYPRRQRQQILLQLDELFQLFYKGVAQVQQFALSGFEETLSGANQEHAPYQGLLYAFLEVFSRVKDGANGLNDITRLHMDFFYKEILQLKHRPHVPDHVHVVTTLARQVETFLQAKDTALKAGKDAKGKDLSFLLEEDVVINKATVEQQRTLAKDDLSNLYIAPVANSADGQGAAFQDPANNSWPVLGAASWISKNNPAAGPQRFPFALSGFMLSSAVLLMREGKREVTVNIGVQGLDVPAADLNNALSTGLLQVQYTSDKGWSTISGPSITYSTNSGNKLNITFTLQPDAPPILPPDEKVLLTAYPVKDPILRILFNQQQQYDLRNRRWYDLLSHTTVTGADINVTATGLKQVLLGNDDGPVDAGKAFFPFGSIPKTDGSFYVGNDEAFRKRLTALSLKLEWQGLPANFQDHYAAYNPDPPINNSSFTVKAQKLDNGNWAELPAVVQALPLFQESGNKLLPDNVLQLDPTALPLPVLTQTAPLAPYSNASLYGFIRFKLNRHFYHQEYPTVLAMQTLRLSQPDIPSKWGDVKLAVNNGDPANRGLVQLTGENRTLSIEADNLADNISTAPTTEELSALTAKTDATRIAADGVHTRADGIKNLMGNEGKVEKIPNAPYTPSIKSFSLNYSAAAATADITLLHQYPYEAGNYKQVPVSPAATLMPVFDDEGSLYLGVKDAVPGGNLSLFFQLAEFSANPDIPAANVYWQYLVGNEWKTLAKDTDVISDTTRSLLVSGIVTIALPWDADLQHTILPSGYHWLKVAAPRHTTAVCEAVIIAAQGARAVFRNRENDLERLAAALPAQTISTLVIPQSAIKSIAQNFPSFGGRKEETDPQFYVRVSERLRHKGRAINIYDYERLVLDAFPAIYKVKCVPHTKICRNDAGIGTPLQSPGWVTLAVIPEIAGFPAGSRFRPKVSRILQQEVSGYLQLRTSGFARVQVINPDYQEVNFSGNIKFRAGRDKQFYRRLLETEVQSFLSPWILTGSQDIVFGSTIMMSSVLQFIEQRAYVEYVTEFKMFRTGGPPEKGITADTPWSIPVAGTQTYDPLD